MVGWTELQRVGPELCTLLSHHAEQNVFSSSFPSKDNPADLQFGLHGFTLAIE